MLLNTVRVLALAQAGLGVWLWLGRHTTGVRPVHLALGALLGLALLALGATTSRRTGRAGAVLGAAGWTALLVAYGVGHPRLLPGDAHWLAQLLHLATGLATVGVAARVAGGASRTAAPPT